MKKYIIRNKKILIVDKPRKLTQDMGPKDMAPEYLEKQQATCPESSKGCKPHGWPKGNPKWTKQQATSDDK